METNLVKEDDYLEVCRNEIEQKINWGLSEEWSHQDFINLSEKIFEETKIRLSSTTLKRIWGKVKYESIPNTSTLNALVNYLGYESWSCFKAHLQPENVQKETKKNSTFLHQENTHDIQKRRFTFQKTGFMAFISLVLISIVAINFFSTEDKKVIQKKGKKLLSEEDLAKITFSIEKIAQGIPNTVVFHYDVSHLDSDEIYIQQSWDIRRRFKVSKDNKVTSSIYYYPGYYRAKLVVDSQIVKEDDLYIKSDGWVVTIENEPVPRYLLENEMTKTGYFGVTDEVMKEINQNQEIPKIMSYHYVQDFGNLSGDNFSFETVLKNTYQKGDGICQSTQIILICSNGFIILPLTIPGCTGDLWLMAGNTYHDGKKHNLSSFGCDFKAWQKLRCEVKNKKIKLYLNNKLIYQLSYQKGIGKFAGIRIKFLGSGQLDDIKVEDAHGKLVYADDFGRD